VSSNEIIEVQWKNHPYRLSDGTWLSFSDIYQILGRVIDREEKKLKLAVIYGSGVGTYGSHAGWITDLLYVPEIISRIALWSLKRGMQLDIVSKLDIDVISDYRVTKEEKEEAMKILKDYNLLIVGDGSVNEVYIKVMEQYEKDERCLVKSLTPIGGIKSMTGGKVTKYPLDTEALAGLLTMLVNPWSNGNRVVIICAGNTSAGTIAALKLLYLMLKDPDKYGRDNLRDGRTPAKIVMARCKKYNLQEEPPMHVGDVDFTVVE